jgi:hypothetical protein
VKKGHARSDIETTPNKDGRYTISFVHVSCDVILPDEDSGKSWLGKSKVLMHAVQISDFNFDNGSAQMKPLQVFLV